MWYYSFEIDEIFSIIMMLTINLCTYESFSYLGAEYYYELAILTGSTYKLYDTAFAICLLIVYVWFVLGWNFIETIQNEILDICSSIND